jgi:carotenoid cleavage dioxygenase
MPDPQHLRRIKIDLARNDGRYEITPAKGTVCELARIDDRYLGHPYQYMWMLIGGPPGGTDAPLPLGGMTGEAEGSSAPDGFIDIFNGDADIGRLDVRTGAIDSYSFGARTNVQEPQFVPRTPDSPEGDGWLLVIVNRLDENRSELAVFDALDLSAGPIALYDLGVRVRSTFHGNWVPAETFRTHRYAWSRTTGAPGNTADGKGDNG